MAASLMDAKREEGIRFHLCVELCNEDTVLNNTQSARLSPRLTPREITAS